MGDDADFFTYHRAASNKLKKRFLKKPNVAEASDEFEQLKNHLARIECFPYAAFTAVAKAKCEQGLMNPPGEIDSLVDAGRYFLKANKETEEMKCPNFYEHLENAVWCFTCAIKIYKDNNMPSMAGNLSLEIADVYFASQKFSQAIKHYRNAVDNFAGIPLQMAAAMDKLLTCQLIARDFHSALVTTMELVELITQKGALHQNGVTPLGYYYDLYKKIEVTRLLLLIILRTRVNVNSKQYSGVLQQYSWPDETGLGSGFHFLDRLLGEDLFAYLRSLLMGCTMKDLNSILALKSDLSHMLTQEQNELLQHIIEDAK